MTTSFSFWDLDIIKVGNRYQVYLRSTNTPQGKTWPTRSDAENYMDQLYSESMSDVMFKPAPKKVVGEGTVETMDVEARSVLGPGKED